MANGTKRYVATCAAIVSLAASVVRAEDAQVTWSVQEDTPGDAASVARTEPRDELKGGRGDAAAPAVDEDARVIRVRYEPALHAERGPKKE